MSIERVMFIFPLEMGPPLQIYIFSFFDRNVQNKGKNIERSSVIGFFNRIMPEDITD